MKEIFVEKSPLYYRIADWEDKMNVTAGFTTKNNGVSKDVFTSLNTGFHVHDKEADVVKNRELIADETGFPLSSWVGAEQTHRTNIRRVTSAEKGLGARDYISALRDTDGLYTDQDGILLTLCFADCVPIFYISEKHHFIGTVHAGWKGTVQGIASEMVSIWKGHGIAPNDIKVVIGPSICQNCYIVDDKVIKEVDKMVEDNSEKPYNLIREGQYSLDLKKCNQLILQTAGVSDISVTGLCTSCRSEAFFSHRRDEGRTGRLMGFIGWKEAVTE